MSIEALRAAFHEAVISTLKPQTRKRIPDILDMLGIPFAVLDWQYREPMRARVLVALKRVLNTAGLKHPSPDKLAAVLMQWFIENEPTTGKPGRRRKSPKGPNGAHT